MLPRRVIATEGIVGPAQIVERPARLDVGGEQRIKGRIFNCRNGAEAKNDQPRRDQRGDKSFL